MTAETAERIEEGAYLARLKEIVAASWPKGVARETEYPLGEIPLSDHVAHWGRQTPDAPAIIYYGREVSYAELDAQANRFAALLKSKGIGAGDRVAVFLPNCPQFHYAFFGILKIGAVHCPVSPMSTAYELGYMLGDTGARALVTLDALMPVVREAEGADRARRRLDDRARPSGAGGADDAAARSRRGGAGRLRRRRGPARRARRHARRSA